MTSFNVFSVLVYMNLWLKYSRENIHAYHDSKVNSVTL